MPRYVAFLRGVSPMNARMPQLRRCFEQAGFTNVRTLLSSGNVVFDAPSRSASAIARKAEATMERELDRTFRTFVRPASHLRALIDADPFAGWELAADAKRVVTFLHAAGAGDTALPRQQDGLRILAVKEADVFTAYIPTPGNPRFMALIEKTFGADVTTRTWETVKKCAAA